MDVINITGKLKVNAIKIISGPKANANKRIIMLIVKIDVKIIVFLQEGLKNAIMPSLSVLKKFLSFIFIFTYYSIDHKIS